MSYLAPSLSTPNAAFLALYATVAGAGAPTGVSVAVTGGNTASVAFTPGAGASSHEIQIETPSGAGNWATAAGAFGSGVFNGTGLTTYTSYQYRIRGVNGTGPSAWVPSGTFFTDNTGSGGGEIPSVPVSAPSFTLQPTAQSAVDGGMVTFSCAVSGSPVPVLQWQISTNSGVSWSDISGAVSATYSRTAVLADSGSLFRVTANNGVSPSITSTTVGLTVTSVIVPPAVTLQPVSVSVVAGTTVTLVSDATGTPTPTPQWKRNGVSISGAVSASYSFTALLGDDGAAYTCDWIGSTTVSSDPAILGVTAAAVAPAISTQPVADTATEGTSASFTVVATGTAPLAYQWLKDGVTIPGANAATYSFLAALGDNGSAYSVVVSNGAGTVTSSAALLAVTPVGGVTPFDQVHVLLFPDSSTPRDPLILSRSRGDTFVDHFLLKSSETSLPIDVTGCSFLMTVDPDSAPVDGTNNIFQLTGLLLNAINGRIGFAPTAEQADLVGSFFFDIQMVDPLGRKRTLKYGSYVLRQDITKN